MNKIKERKLVAGEKFLSEFNLIQPGVTYIALGTFTKSRERFQKIEKQGTQNVSTKFD